MQVYFDNSATTPLCPEAVAAITKALTDNWGNPSSTHSRGRAALELMDTARRQVAGALGCAASELFFTSGGTEADNWALNSGARRRRKGRIIISDTEHEAVKNPAEALSRQGYEVIRLAPDTMGRITLESLKAALTPDTILVSVMLVNNETGAVNPVKAMAAATHAAAKDALFHTDAVQAFGKLDFTPKGLGVDLMSISSHKIMGPKGAGALYVRGGLKLGAFMLGGGQEREMRSGTEAVPAIAGFGAAAEQAGKKRRKNYEKLCTLREYAVEQLSQRVPGIVFIGAGAAPHILSVSLPGYRSEVLTNYLDSLDICVSNASACRRGRRSEVLTAMKLDNSVIDGALRLSFSPDNTKEEIDYFTASLSRAREVLRTGAGRA